jgi:xylulokinase
MICGGGSKSPLWRQMMANVLGIPLDIPQTEQGPGYGAAILAMVGAGLYPDVRKACDKLVHVAETIEPEPEMKALYQERYDKFRKIYPACKELFKELM